MNKIYKYIASISKNVYTDELATKMKSVDLKPSTYINFNLDNKDKNPKS